MNENLSYFNGPHDTWYRVTWYMVHVVTWHLVLRVSLIAEDATGRARSARRAQCSCRARLPEASRYPLIPIG
eukprot:scaffold201_cov121-Isochrysis_galbana.AAC.9